MSQHESEKLAGTLAMRAADIGIRAFMARITKAIKSKGITLAKILRIYAIVEKAVKDVESILAEK
jgi:hypothetical protein